MINYYRLKRAKELKKQMKRLLLKRSTQAILAVALALGWTFFNWPGFPFIPKVMEAQAVAQGDGIVLYAKSTNDGVYQRTFTAPDQVTGETNILSGFTDTVRYIELKAAPTRNEMIAVVQAAISTTGSSIVVLRWNGSAWSVPFCIRTGGGTIGGTACTNATYITNANTVRRAVAVEYENSSGDAMVLYSSGASGTNGLKYQTWNGSTWSGETNLDSARLTGIITWVELVPKPAANEMTALIADSVNRDLSALVWDGTSAWGTEPAALLEAELEDIGAGTNPTVRPFDGAYESSSGDFLAGWGYSIAETEATELRYVQRPSGGAWGSVTTPTVFPDIITILDMAADPDSASNYIVAAGQDPVAADNTCSVWTGTQWADGAPSNCDTTAGAQVAGNQGFGVGFVKSGSTKRAIVVWPEAASGNLNYYYSNPTTDTWATATFAIAGAASAITTPVEVKMDPFNTNILMATVQKGSGIHMLKLSIDATPTFTWTNPLGAALATSPTTGLYQPFSFAFNRYIPPVPVTDQSLYRWHNDDGNEAGATQREATNTPATNVNVGADAELIRLQFSVKETNNASFTLDSRIEFSSDASSCTTGSWTAMDTSSTAWRLVDSTWFTNDTNTTQRISSPDSFTAGSILDTANPDSTAITIQNNTTEVEFAFKGLGASMSATYRFRITDNGSTLNTYTNCGQASTEIAPGPTIDQVMRHGNWFSGGTEQGFFWAD